MIPIKIQCGCGQKYAVDVEPVNGLMSYAVLCPVCGVDGTAMANELIEQRLAAQPASNPALRLDRHVPPSTPQPPASRSLPSVAPDRNFAGPKARKKLLLPAISGSVFLILVAGVLLGRNLGQSHKPAEVVAADKDG